MKQNVGTIDRIIRVLAGVVLLSLTQILEGDIRWVGLIGIVPLLTAAMGFCPLYCPFKLNTTGRCGGEKKEGPCCGGGSCGTDDKKDAA